MTKFVNFDTIHFIKEVQKRPALWDTSVEHNKELKKKAWDEIIDVLGEENMSKTEKLLLACKIQQRWKNLRTCFAREMKRQKDYGAGTSRKSEYVYYKNLQFLTRVMNIAEKDTKENMEYDNFEDNDSTSRSSVDYCQTDLPQTSFDKDTRRNTSKRKPDEYEEPFSDEEGDEDRLFLLSLHKTLRRVPRNKKIAVKIKMLSILNETLS